MVIPQTNKKSGDDDADNLHSKQQDYFFKTKNRDPYSYVKPAEAPPVGHYRIISKTNDDMKKINYPKNPH
jgi:hypothetical protein